MAARPSWKAFLRLSLVTTPVKGYTAHATASDVPLHQIHAKCHRRIQYRKVCPVHGEVAKDEIVPGYEIAKGKYVEIDPDELDKMRSPTRRSTSTPSSGRRRSIRPTSTVRHTTCFPTARRAKNPTSPPPTARL